MFRHKSSRRLNRKSTSAPSKPETIDPEMARRHAFAAATLAFAQAQERKSADVVYSHGTRRSKQNTSSRSEQTTFSQSSTAGSSKGEPALHRQPSVRFSGPNPPPRKRAITSRAPNSLQPKASSAAARPVAITTDAAVPAAYQPPGRSSSIGKANAESFISSLSAYDEYYKREDEILSTPSSYRRLRRSKSTFSILRPPSVLYSTGSPNGHSFSYNRRQGSLSGSRTPQSQQHQALLRAPKSMGFLRGGRASTLRQSNDEAVQLARDRFFQQATQERLREQPSFLFRSRAQRQEKSLRKSLRSTSMNDNALPVGSADQEMAPKEQGLGDKVRQVSKSFKTKIKRVFGLSKDEPVVIPNQQVDARDTHVQNYFPGPTSVHEGSSDIPYPDEVQLSHVASRSTLRAPASSEHLRSGGCSIRSARSFRTEHSDDASRVTSWTSTAANTVASHGMRVLSEKEQQRLSIIKEHGTHIPSSTFKRVPSTNQISAYPVIRQVGRCSKSVPPPAPRAVNSARVYSALMRRLDENSPNQKFVGSSKGSVENFFTPRTGPEYGSSISSSRGNRTPATIRRVQQEGATNHTAKNDGSYSRDRHRTQSSSDHSSRSASVHGYTGLHQQQWVAANPIREMRVCSDDDVFVQNSAPSALSQGRSSCNSSTLTVSRQPNNKVPYYAAPRVVSGHTPQEAALQNEPVVQERKLRRESRSAFFGGSQMTISRTTSPFRRAMTESDYSPVAVTREGYGSINTSPVCDAVSTGQENLPNDVDNAEDGDSPKAYSESLYSRTTGGQPLGPGSSNISLPIDEHTTNTQPRNQGTGDVVIIDRATYRPSMPNSAVQNVSRSASSSEWKRWMSSEVAKLERAKENSSSFAYVNYALPTMPRSFQTGHIREGAQTDEEDTEIIGHKVAPEILPLGVMAQQNPNIQNPTLPKPILKKPQALSCENSEAKYSSTTSIPVPTAPPPPPPIPVRSPLRPSPLKSPLRSVGIWNGHRPVNSVSSMDGARSLYSRHGSTTTLRSVRSFETPARLARKQSRRFGPMIGSSPGGELNAAVETQFGSISTRSRTPALSINQEIGHSGVSIRGGTDDIYGADGAGLMGPSIGEISERDAQIMGSKRMVDLFLSSRRRKITGGSDESGVFI